MSTSDMQYCPECGIKSTAGARVLRGEKGTMAATQNAMERLRAERDALQQQLNAAIEREVAMADRCPEGWQAVPKTVTPEMSEAYASDAYDTAQQCHDAVLGAAPHPGDADEVISSKPTTNLARRDLIKQAEALESESSKDGYSLWASGRLSESAKEYRQRAQELTE